jgi:hypothetical protein
MENRRNIQVDLVKLADGARLLRLTYSPSGLALEKVLDPKVALVHQKKRLFHVFEAALAQSELSPA